MRRRLAVLALLALAPACRPSDGSAVDDTGTDTSDPGTDTSGDTSGDTSDTSEVERPTLVSPLELAPTEEDPTHLEVLLEPREVTVEVGGVAYDGYSYLDGAVPGPTLRLPFGATLTATVVNGLDRETTVHWHGLDVPVAMDGVEWIVDPIPPDGVYTYTFPVEQAGTFWYHPHVDTEHQVDHGLYGVVVVEEEDPPAFDAELVVVLDAWGESGDEDAPHDEHGLYLPEDVTWAVNGVVDPVYRPAPGTRVRVRMVNASNLAYAAVGFPGMRIIGGDQGLLAAPGTDDRAILSPGDRAELEMLVGDAGFDVDTLAYVPAGGAAWGDPVRLFSVAPEGPSAAAPAPLELPWSEAAPSPDPPYTDLTYVFSGGAEGEDWLINGEAWPDVTVHSAPLDRETIIEVRNLSPTEHPFHLHGNEFEVLSVDGEAPPWRSIEDTLNVPIRSTARLRLLPHNPGDWALHCHILPHAHAGMMTVLRVEAETE